MKNNVRFTIKKDVNIYVYTNTDNNVIISFLVGDEQVSYDISLDFIDLIKEEINFRTSPLGEVDASVRSVLESLKEQFTNAVNFINKQDVMKDE